jgi:D-amino peptidase
LKVYIVTDMEGISGVNREEMVNQGAGEWYAQGRRLMMGDINAAIRGAFDGGATEVLVCDGHGGAPHLILEDMDERAEYARPGSPILFGLDESFDAMFLVGTHAMAGTPDAFLDHTQSSLAWYNYFVNGRKFGEIGQEAMVGGHYGIPLVLATGDHAACMEAQELLGDGVVTVEVKSAIGRQWARCLHPRVAQAKIQEGSARAMKLVGTAKPFLIDTPALVRLELYRTDMADGYMGSHRVRRVGPREIEFTAETAADILAFS